MRFPEVALRLPDWVLREYAESGGEIYNPRRGSP